MKLLFLILAHDRPEQALELARTLVEAARDGVAMIHYDRRSPADEFAKLEAAASVEPRIRLVARRVATRWGSFGLVEAPINALAQAEAERIEPDYVILLSGACLPCKPIAQLENYLEANYGREFIEAEDENWVTDGWRSERWRYRFWFNHRSQRPLEWAFFHAQRLLGIRRCFPGGLTPRLGSQWWTLTWNTCQKILDETRNNPRRFGFFRTVWIPDEMVFQTYVHALANPGHISGFSLTHFQFTNYGMPVVFYDDHIDYAQTLGSFFLRKAAPEAVGLRTALLARASAAADAQATDLIGRRGHDYAIKIAAQTHYPVPGQTFYRDQRTDMDDTVLARVDSPYIVVFGPSSLTRHVTANIPDSLFMRLGAIFAPESVDLGEKDGAPRQILKGLRRDDVAIRDQHPALYLARVRTRCEQVPVIRWSPFDAPTLFAAVLRDPNAVVVACLPFTGDKSLDKKLLALSAFPDRARMVGPAALAALGLDMKRATEAVIDNLVERSGWLDWVGRALFYDQIADQGSRSSIILMPLHPVSPSAGAAQLGKHFELSRDTCRFRTASWFSALQDGLQVARAQIEDDPMTCLLTSSGDFGTSREFAKDMLLKLLNPTAAFDVQPSPTRTEKQLISTPVRESKASPNAKVMT